jgi:peroxiredoxin
MSALKAGEIAPDFSLPTVDGKRFSLADALRRGPVVLAFFKISCPVCQYELPFLERMYAEYKGKSVTVVGVSQNAKQDTQGFLKQYGISFPTALDDRGTYEVSNAYGITHVPTIFYISAAGEIEISSVGWSRSDVAEISSRLAETLKAPRASVFRPGEDVPELRAG